MNEVPKPAGYEEHLGGFQVITYDGGCGEPVSWGWRILNHLGPQLFSRIDKEYGEATNSWYAVARRLTFDEAVRKYGPVTKLVTGPRGGFKSVTLGEKLFLSIRPDTSLISSDLIEVQA
jgi:hypothetical protein